MPTNPIQLKQNIIFQAEIIFVIFQTNLNYLSFGIAIFHEIYDKLMKKQTYF